MSQINPFRSPQSVAERSFEVQFVANSDWSWYVPKEPSDILKGKIYRLRADYISNWIKQERDKVATEKVEAPKTQQDAAVSVALDIFKNIPPDTVLFQYWDRFSWEQNEDVLKLMLDEITIPKGSSPVASSILTDSNCDKDLVSEVLKYFFDKAYPLKEPESSQDVSPKSETTFEPTIG